MKRLLMAIATVALLYSCDNTTAVAGTEEENRSAKNSEHMKAIFKAIETGDMSAVDTLFADNVVDHNANPDNSDRVGKDSVMAMLREIHTYFDGLKIEHMADATSADGQYMFALSRMTGTAKANPWGMPEGMQMDDTSVDVVKLENGKATEHWGFISMGDFNEIMKMMDGGQGNAADTSKMETDTTRR